MFETLQTKASYHLPSSSQTLHCVKYVIYVSAQHEQLFPHVHPKRNIDFVVCCEGFSKNALVSSANDCFKIKLQAYLMMSLLKLLLIGNGSPTLTSFRIFQ